jgi:hypothetical protein
MDDFEDTLVRLGVEQQGAWVDQITTVAAAVGITPEGLRARYFDAVHAAKGSVHAQNEENRLERILGGVAIFGLLGGPPDLALLDQIAATMHVYCCP